MGKKLLIVSSIMFAIMFIGILSIIFVITVDKGKESINNNMLQPVMMEMEVDQWYYGSYISGLMDTSKVYLGSIEITQANLASKIDFNKEYKCTKIIGNQYYFSTS